MIVTGDGRPARGRPRWFAYHLPYSRRINFHRYWPGHRPSRASASFINIRSTRRLATWAGVVVGSRRKAPRRAHLWQAHRQIAEARGKAIRAKRTEQNPTN